MCLELSTGRFYVRKVQRCEHFAQQIFVNKTGQVFAITDLSKDGNVLVLIGTLRGIFTRITTKRAIALLRTCRRETIVLVCALYVFLLYIVSKKVTEFNENGFAFCHEA